MTCELTGEPSGWGGSGVVPDCKIILADFENVECFTTTDTVTQVTRQSQPQAAAEMSTGYMSAIAS